MGMPILRVLAGIATGVAVIAAFIALGWFYPRVAVGLFLVLFSVGWTWLLSRSLRTGSVMVKGARYLRAKSPVAYWGWLGFYFLVGIYLLGGGAYALVFIKP